MAGSGEGGVVREERGVSELVLKARDDDEVTGDDCWQGAEMSEVASSTRPTDLLRLLLLDRSPSALLLRHSDSSLATMSDTLMLSDSSPLPSGGGALDSVMVAELLWMTSRGLESGCCSLTLCSRNATISTTDTFRSSSGTVTVSPDN